MLHQANGTCLLRFILLQLCMCVDGFRRRADEFLLFEADRALMKLLRQAGRVAAATVLHVMTTAAGIAPGRGLRGL